MEIKKLDIKFIHIGFLSGLITAICCIGPLILVALGFDIAASSFAAFFGRYHFFIGILFFIASTLYILKKEKRIGCACKEKAGQHFHIPIPQIGTALAIMVIVYILLAYIIIPYLMLLIKYMIGKFK